MLIVDQIRTLNRELKVKLDIARDNGDKYCYIQLGQEQLGVPWSETMVNEMLRELQDADARLLSHSTHTFNHFMKPPMNGVQERTQITFLFELIYK